MGNLHTPDKRNFFDSEFYTEFFIPETLEVWLYGDHRKAITEDTPRICLGTSNHWDTSGLFFVSLPITDGHGTVEYKEGYIYEEYANECIGTTHEHLISEWYTFNA
jgi:hypothetical protein